MKPFQSSSSNSLVDYMNCTSCLEKNMSVCLYDFMKSYWSSPNGIMITRDPVRKETDIRSAVQKFIYSG